MKTFYKELLIFSVVSLIAGCASVYLSNNTSNNSTEAFNSTSIPVVAAKSATVISVKSTKVSAAETSKVQQNSADFAKLKEDLNKYIGTYDKNVGLYYYDLTTGNSMEINSSEEFVAASTVKVPMNMVLLDMAKSGKLNLESKVKYISSDYEAGTGILQGQDLDDPIPLKTLMCYSIVYSDNIATQMIIRTIGHENMHASIDKIIGRTTDHSLNVYTAKDFGIVLRRLYSNPEKNPYYAQLIEYMKNTDFHDAIDKNIPQNITAHKIGGYESYSNDIAIVYADKPYILVVLTNEIPNSSDKIADISKIIYDYQSNLE